MLVKILKTVYAPSVIGTEPAFEGDVVNVNDETAGELIATGQAEDPNAVAEVEAPSEAAAEPAPAESSKADATEAYKAARATEDS